MPGFFDFINDFAEGGGGGGGGILGPLSDWAGNNSNALIGLGTGIAGAANGQGWGAGPQAGLQGFQSGRQADLKQQQLMAGRSPSAPSSAAYWPAAPWPSASSPAAPSDGFFGSLGNWAGNNSNALIGLGAGIAGAANGKGWGAGLQAGLQGFQNARQADQKQQQQQATYQYLLGRGLSPQYAQMMISNSSR